MRIGEILVGNGVITAEQLELGLRSQVIHGGRLGTNLIELYELDLDDLANALAVQHQLPPALQVHFNRCNPDVQKLLPPALAALLKAIPIGYVSGVGRAQVAVAVMDPLSPEQIDRLSNALGAQAVLCIACQLRIYYQLDHVYNIPRPNRFKRARRATQPPPEVLAELPEDERLGRQRRQFVQTLSDIDEAGEDSADFEIDLDDEDPHERSRRHLARIALRRVSRAPVVGERVHDPDPQSFDDAIKAIRRAHDRDKVAELTVDCLAHAFDGVFDAAVFFVVRDQLAIAWKGFVADGEPPPWEQVALPLGEPSLAAGPLASRQLNISAPVADGTLLDQRLWAVLGQGAPEAVVTLPIELFDEVACLVYAQSASAAAVDDETAARLNRLQKRVTGAFKRLIEAAQR